MRNFAEEMAYWYFRLNGFFVIDNFVLHRQHLDSSQSADIDLLAIRNQYTFEEIGGREIDRDSLLFNHLNMNKNIGIICEVKSGKSFNKKDIKINRIDRLKYGINRIGVFSPLKALQKADELREKSSIEGTYHQIAKVLISDKKVSFPEMICISLEHVQKFLYDHMKTHKDPKNDSRHFFPSELLQYIIWDVEKREKRLSAKDFI